MNQWWVIILRKYFANLFTLSVNLFFFCRCHLFMVFKAVWLRRNSAHWKFLWSTAKSIILLRRQSSEPMMEVSSIFDLIWKKMLILLYYLWTFKKTIVAGGEILNLLSLSYVFGILSTLLHVYIWWLIINDSFGIVRI